MMNRARTQDIQAELTRRGIFDSWARHGLEPQGNKARYPIFNLAGETIGHRVKFLNHPKFKYLWSPKKPQSEIAEWYILPGTAKAIAEADGICYLANGEPALHAYHSATVYNTIATTLSEVAVPKNILSIFKSLGIKKLINIADSDEAGRGAATNWRDALYGSGIDYQALQWPDGLGDKADANDAWIDYDFNAHAFQHVIKNCRALLLRAYEIAPDTPVNTDIPDITEPLSGAIAEAIAPRMTGKVHNGFHMHTCVHHDDKKASAGFDPTTGVINCFACGSHSPYETAEALGIDWRSFYPHRNHAPSTRPDRDEATLQASQDRLKQVDKAYQDRLIHLNKIQNYLETPAGRIDMAQSAHIDWLHGRYRSWWKTEDVPIGHLSAIMNLNNTRSSTALVLGRMHQALLDGRLSHAVISIPLVSDVIGLSTRVVSNAILELERGGYIRFLGTYSIYTILHTVYNNIPQQSVHTPYLNQTPARLWTLNFNHEDLIMRLYRQLCVKKTEAYHRRTVAKSTQKLGEGMGLSFEEFKELQSLDDLFAKDKLSKKAQAELRIELEGASDGSWRGWKCVLRSDFAVPVDWYACDTVKDVRGQMLRYWVDEVRAQNSRVELSRLLGCSETTLDNLYRDYDVVSVEQQRKHEIKTNFDDIRPAMKRLQREQSAHIWQVSFYQFNEETNKYKWFSVHGAAAGRYYKSNQDNIKKAFFLYNVPSYQYQKSIASWDLNWQRFIVCMAQYLIVKHADTLTGETQVTPDDIEPVSSTPSASDNTPAEDKTTLSMQHVYTTHTPQFCKDQMALRVEMATGYKVMGDSIVQAVDPPLVPFLSQTDANRFAGQRTQVVFMPLRGKRNNGMLQFIRDNNVKKLVKNSYEVFGKDVEDYDEELNAEYKAERERELINLVDVPDFDMPDGTLEAKSQKVLHMPQSDRPQELTERQKLMVEFWTTRYETERKNKPKQESRFKFIRKYADKPDEKAG